MKVVRTPNAEIGFHAKTPGRKLQESGTASDGQKFWFFDPFRGAGIGASSRRDERR